MDAGTLPADPAADPKPWSQHKIFVQDLSHVTSLLHAAALQHLRSDWELANIVPCQTSDTPPPIVSVCLLNVNQLGQIDAKFCMSMNT